MHTSSKPGCRAALVGIAVLALGVAGCGTPPQPTKPGAPLADVRPGPAAVGVRPVTPPDTGEVAAGPVDALAAPGQWPTNVEGRLFSFATDSLRDPPFALEADGKRIDSYGLVTDAMRPRAFALTDRHGALRVHAGSYLLQRVPSYIAERARACNAFTLQAWVRPHSAEQDGVIIGFRQSAAACNIALTQRGARLVVRIGTRAGDGSDSVAEYDAGALGAAARHVAVAAGDGQLTICLDGTPTSRASTGSLACWREMPLVFGSDVDGGGDWAGYIEGVAIHARALPPSEIARDARAWRAVVDARAAVPVVRVRARLVQKTAAPDVDRIEPYTRALAMFVYRVEEVVQGTCEEDHVAVFHWVILDKTPLPFCGIPLGTRVDLTLERFDDHPLLETEWQSDDTDALERGLDAYFDAAFLSLDGRPDHGR